MSEQQHHESLESAAAIRIMQMNTDKTRKETGSDTMYHVYLELSGHPLPEWRDIFGREWKGLGMTHEASIDGGFLVLHCTLDEVATTLLPALKKAVTATNEAYDQYARKEATALEHREDAWREERNVVEAMAASLRFD